MSLVSGEHKTMSQVRHSGPRFGSSYHLWCWHLMSGRHQSLRQGSFSAIPTAHYFLVGTKGGVPLLGISGTTLTEEIFGFLCGLLKKGWGEKDVKIVGQCSDLSCAVDGQEVVSCSFAVWAVRSGKQSIYVWTTHERSLFLCWQLLQKYGQTQNVAIKNAPRKTRVSEKERAVRLGGLRFRVFISAQRFARCVCESAARLDVLAFVLYFYDSN